jgi:Phosphotransferase enzyme family
MMFDVASTVKDLALGVSPWVPGQRHFRFEDLSADEFTEVLGARRPGARVDNVAVERVSRGTTDRARLALTWNAAGVAAGLPTALFAKGTPTTPSSRILVSTFGLNDYETNFYTQVYPSVPELTMTPIIARTGSGGRYLIVMEDLAADERAHFFTAAEDAPLSHTEGVIDGLATLHGRFWNSPRFVTDLKWLTPYNGRKGHALAHPTLKLATTKYLRQHPDLPPTVRRLTEFYIRNRTAMDRAYEALPQTFTHGDPHLGNTFTRADGTSGIYDWQIVHKMNGLRDVAYHLGHSVPTEIRRAQEKNLLGRYLDGLAAAGGEAPSMAEAFDTYRMLLMEAWISVYTTVAIGGMQEKAVTDSATERCVAAMVDLDTEAALRAVI